MDDLEESLNFQAGCVLYMQAFFTGEGLSYWFSDAGEFVPNEHLPMSGGIFGYEDWEGSSWYQEGGVQGCFLTPYSAPTQEIIICPQMSTNIFLQRCRPQQVIVHCYKQGLKGLKSVWHCVSWFCKEDLAESQ